MNLRHAISGASLAVAAIAAASAGGARAASAGASDVQAGLRQAPASAPAARAHPGIINPDNPYNCNGGYGGQLCVGVNDDGPNPGTYINNVQIQVDLSGGPVDVVYSVTGPGGFYSRAAYQGGPGWVHQMTAAVNDTTAGRYCGSVSGNGVSISNVCVTAP